MASQVSYFKKKQNQKCLFEILYFLHYLWIEFGRDFKVRMQLI